MYLPASVSVATILCGTNNMDNNVYQPHDIAHSVIACDTRLREKHPRLNVIVVGILPRDFILDGTISKIRNKIQQTNDILKQVCWKLGFSYIEPASQWTTSSDELNHRLFWKDKLHINKKGCNLLAKQINIGISINLSLSPQSPPCCPSSQSPPCPELYTIGRCRSNEEQLAYIETRIECLEGLETGLHLKAIGEKYESNILNDYVRLFKGDGPAVAFEAGNQKGEGGGGGVLFLPLL